MGESKDAYLVGQVSLGSWSYCTKQPSAALPVILGSYFSHLPTPTSNQPPKPLGICLLNLPDPFLSIQPIYALCQATVSHLGYCNNLLAVICLQSILHTAARLI